MRRRKPSGRKPTVPVTVPPPKLPGRYGKTWLSPEFVTWCKRNHYRPEGLARCILHTFALSAGNRAIIVTSNKPIPSADLYDLPGDGKEKA